MSQSNLPTERSVRVGLLKAKAVDVCFDGLFADSRSPLPISGPLKLSAQDAGRTFSPVDSDAKFWVDDVMIGIGFHWQRCQRLAFAGCLEVAACPDGEIRIINRVAVEEYLASVISSEMSGHASDALLEAHAVISRSWLMRMLSPCACIPAEEMISTAEVVKKWYDRDDHVGFDVCADDHCQRYQGVTRLVDRRARQAVEATRGLVLFGPDARIVDARFSKCCGGAFERFDSCWSANIPNPCLQPAPDRCTPDAKMPDLSVEEYAREWILGTPVAFCNTDNWEVLAQVLNDFDSSTTPDFFRWRVEYSPAELSALVKERSGRDLGMISDLIPLQRGSSGRISQLKIVGSKGSVAVGKELEIRRWLSSSHLKSSAFVVSRSPQGNFILNGAGWGHGVGLCQIGAAMMASQGFTSSQILAHYYRGSQLKKLW